MRKITKLKAIKTTKKRASGPLRAVAVRSTKVTKLAPGRKISKVTAHKKRAIVLRKKAA